MKQVFLQSSTITHTPTRKVGPARVASFISKGIIGKLLLAGIFVTVPGALAFGVNSFQLWRRKEYTRIHKNSTIIGTAVGPVEYQRTGSGPAVLYVHGTPGGYDQGIAFARFFSDNRCTFISPSRPGYLRTPLASGPSPEQQADLYAALLDELGIQSASIIGFSGGGPSALQFALRYPDRCRGLAVVGGIAQRNCKYERVRTLPRWKQLFTEIVEHLLVSDPFLFSILPFTRFLYKGNAVAGMLSSGTLYHLRAAGYENDMAQFAAMGEYPLEKITAPTLVVHGTKDEDVPFEDAELLIKKVPGATLLALEGGDHAAFYTYAKTVMPALQDFLTSESSIVLA
jgi:pimeloyl-ACP methyl ester carboxylesterase